ncbi:uncharacterized protein LAESUDRAFT_763122 [Laetiporus sulphureus 93-53]|uniref:Uncharacterized protein n=1 Tax=Laetiporus sulphureus 93-53 TaxID=1314785 RepID=A0A165C4D6_9APHY|nr:uncharacterized protein LAESUDRAFT_763122 [Laetiporus sulphureus 93-53]KZT02184.1 hypothetical protein LAESUDRAFT_763122 [Laetiporus sulphureus 93-53]
MFASIKSLFVLGCLALSAFAQNIAISAPAAGDTVSAGSNITVRVDKPATLTGSTDVAIAICLKSCAGYTGGCASFDTTEVLGDILYTGPYDPIYGSGDWYPFQNFTVQVPAGMESGEASLSVTHLVLVGAGPMPIMQVANETIIIG